MTELDLLTLGRSITTNEVSLFSQIIAITFAMIVAIYYFLNQARLAIKIFAFCAYMVGGLLFLGEMLLETNLKFSVLQVMRAMPHPSPVLQEYIGLNDTWLSITTRVLFNGAIWVLWIGVFYLLFFWKKHLEIRTQD